MFILAARAPRRFSLCLAVCLMGFPSLATSSNATPSSAVGPRHVTFVLEAPSLAEDETVYITGGAQPLGNWNPAAVRMEGHGHHTWTKSIVLEGPTSLEYKYTLGSWDREGAAASGAALPNFEIAVSADVTVTDRVPSWTHGAKTRPAPRPIVGTVKYHRAMKGSGIKDRDVIVWLPPSYETNRNERYGVLYMQDGQNIIDPATSSFGVAWDIDVTVDRLIRSGTIPPLIVVGIYNTPDRTQEYSPGPTGTAYMNFVTTTLKPFIDATYRTKPDRVHTIVGGSSSGGIISFMLVWEHPDLFSKAICMSPALKVPGHWDYVREVQTAHDRRRDIFLYLDIGVHGVDTVLAPGVDDMCTALRAQSYEDGRDFVLVRDPVGQHFEADWARRFPAALVTVLAK